MIPELNKARREATERDLDGWVLTSGTPPGQRTGTMLVMADRAGRPYAIGCGETELEAANALLSDMTNRARSWLMVRRMARTWRDHLRAESEARRAQESAAFLSSRTNHQP
jgi:hypothetical protein